MTVWGRVVLPPSIIAAAPSVVLLEGDEVSLLPHIGLMTPVSGEYEKIWFMTKPPVDWADIVDGALGSADEVSLRQGSAVRGAGDGGLASYVAQ